MTQDEAVDLIRASVSRGSATPTMGADPDKYVREHAAALLDCAIEPIRAIVTGETFEHGLFARFQTEESLAIARSGDKWLLYRPAAGEYSLAYGKDPAQLVIWGFSSDDALTEWLG